MEKRRIAVIGLDSLEWWNLERLMDDGRIPNIGEHVSRSKILRLDCPSPYRAESIWTEFFTGRTRDENGYWTTAEFDPDTYGTWTCGAYRGAPFYARPDLVPVVFDIPHAPVAPECRGIQVAGWGAHSPQFPTSSRPSNTVVDIDEVFGVNGAMTIDSHAGWHSPAYQAVLAEALSSGALTKAKIGAWLLDEQPDWDLSVVVFTEPHVAGHQFWHGVEPTHPLYATEHGERARRHHDQVMADVDTAVGALTATLPDDVDVIFLAAHGMQTNGSDVTGGVLVSELLLRWQLGRALIDFEPLDAVPSPFVLPDHVLPIHYLEERLVEPRSSMADEGGLGSVARRSLHELRHRSPDLAERAVGLARRLSGRPVPNWWEPSARPPARRFTDLAAETARQPLDYQVPCWYRRYWPQMRAFVLPAFSDGHIRINLIGREANGTVSKEDYESVMDEVEALLRECVDVSTGEGIVASFERPRADAPFDPDGPTSDLVVAFRGASEAIRHPRFGVIGPSPLMRSGEHSTGGWLARRSDGRSEVPGVAHPRDVAPTLLELGGHASSPTVTGRSFADVLR